ncbi:MAG TPA: hypothetical protein VLT83_14530, partial [Opitutaceae bacterium]|nr:hypothetical protein [Opitutaceae bacterium]
MESPFTLDRNGRSISIGTRNQLADYGGAPPGLDLVGVRGAVRRFGRFVRAGLGFRHVDEAGGLGRFEAPLQRRSRSVLFIQRKVAGRFTQGRGEQRA